MDVVTQQPFKLYFVYATANWIALGAVAGVAGQANIGILDDADFACQYCTVAVEQANVLVVNWSGLIQVEDTGTGRTLFSNPIPVQSIAGSGELPYPFSPARLFRKNSTLVVTVTNSAAATATNVRVQLHGHKLFAQAPPEYR